LTGAQSHSEQSALKDQKITGRILAYIWFKFETRSGARQEVPLPLEPRQCASVFHRLRLGGRLPIGLTQSSLWALLLGVITLDLGLQPVHVTSQRMIYAVRPETQSRLTAGYRVFYSIGSALGSIGSAAMYAWGGWVGVCLLGAGINAVALIYWWRTLPRKTHEPCGEGIYPLATIELGGADQL
jgi:MFS family permease